MLLRDKWQIRIVATVIPIEIVWFWTLLTALAFVVCTVFLRAACLAANGVNQVANQGSPIPLPDYKEATVNILFAALTFALLKLLFLEMGISESQILSTIASTLATLVFVFLVAVHLPWLQGTRRSLLVLASCFYVIVLMLLAMATRGLIALVG